MTDQTQELSGPTEAAYEEATQRGYERTALPDDYGLFSYLDIPPAMCGSGVGGFLWFSDREGMLAYVKDYLSWDPTRVSRPEPIDVERARAAHGVLAAEARPDDAATLEAVNRALAGLHQITWWGPFRELLGGDGEYVRQLRTDFRVCDADEEESPQSGRPIGEGELDAFRLFLREYGL